MTNKKLSDFKALLFDIDGTLTDTDRQISSETVIALEKLSQRGFIIGVCTGRGVASIRSKILPLFPENSFHITTGGSQLVNSKGKVIEEHPIDSQSIKEIKKYVENSQLVAIFMKEDAQYAMEPTLTNLKNHPWGGVAKNLSEMNNDGVGNIYITNLNSDTIEYIKNNHNLSYKHMTNNYGIPYMDITAKGVNKAITLQQWSKQTNISMNQIIGFGDGSNDMEFLSACGFSVSMGNATAELKKITNTTIGHTDDNGLAKYLSKIIKGDNL